MLLRHSQRMRRSGWAMTMTMTIHCLLDRPPVSASASGVVVVVVAEAEAEAADGEHRPQRGVQAQDPLPEPHQALVRVLAQVLALLQWTMAVLAMLMLVTLTLQLRMWKTMTAATTRRRKTASAWATAWLAQRWLPSLVHLQSSQSRGWLQSRGRLTVRIWLQRKSCCSRSQLLSCAGAAPLWRAGENVSCCSRKLGEALVPAC